MSDSVVHGVDVDALAARVTSCPSVARLAGGALEEAASYLPGRRIAGVRVTPESVELHVVATAHSPIPRLDREVREAVAPLVAGRTVDLFVDDVANPTGPPPDVDLRAVP